MRGPEPPLVAFDANMHRPHKRAQRWDNMGPCAAVVLHCALLPPAA